MLFLRSEISNDIDRKGHFITVLEEVGARFIDRENLRVVSWLAARATNCLRYTDVVKFRLKPLCSTRGSIMVKDVRIMLEKDVTTRKALSNSEKQLKPPASKNCTQELLRARISAR